MDEGGIMEDLGERLAVLEEKDRQKDEILKEMVKKLDDIMETMTRYKGFIGGILFVATCVATFMSTFGDMIARKIGFK